MNIERVSPEEVRSSFGKLVKMSFFDLGKAQDSLAATYLTDMLTEFARTERLYKIQDSSGRKIQTIVEMLIETEGVKDESTESEREVRKYVGDFALFMSGVFRDYVNRGSYLRYYMDEGMKSYFAVSRLAEKNSGEEIAYVKTGIVFMHYEKREVAPVPQKFKELFPSADYLIEVQK